MKSPNFLSSATARRIKSISNCSGIQIVWRVVRFSGIAGDQNKKAMPEGMAKRFDPEGETTKVESNRREREAGISSGLFNRTVGGTYVSPIDIRAEVFAADSAKAFALDIDCQPLGTAFTVSDVCEVARRRSAFMRELIALSFRQAHEEGFECAHAPDNNRTVNVLQ